MQLMQDLCREKQCKTMHLVVDIVVAHYLGSQLVLILFRPSYKNGSKVLLKVVATDDIDWLRRREKV